jgi:hypothetical protein
MGSDPPVAEKGRAADLARAASRKASRTIPASRLPSPGAPAAIWGHSTPPSQAMERKIASRNPASPIRLVTNARVAFSVA